MSSQYSALVKKMKSHLLLAIIATGICTAICYWIYDWSRVLRYDHAPWKLLTEARIEKVFRDKLSLLRRIDTMMNTAGVAYTISHGTLLEFARGMPIYHDDDIDVIFSAYDRARWERFCLAHSREDMEKQFGVKFDDRQHDIWKQRRDGCQLFLVDPQSDVTVHADLVSENVHVACVWLLHSVDFKRLRRVEIKYPGINETATVSCMSREDSRRFLRIEYGPRWRVPHKRYTFARGKVYENTRFQHSLPKRLAR